MRIVLFFLFLHLSFLQIITINNCPSFYTLISANNTQSFILTNNIDCNFNSTTVSSFMGNLDGNNFTISNLNTKLFGNGVNASVSNLIVENAQIVGSSYQGVFFSLISNTSITNCHVTTNDSFSNLVNCTNNCCCGNSFNQSD